MRRALCSCFVLAALAAPACGGAQKPGGANGAEGSASGAGDEDLGDYAKSHGGIRTLGGAPQSGAAQPVPEGLHADLLDGKVVVDGVLGEWPARDLMKHVVKGGGVTVSYGLQYDDAKLYFGAEVQQDGLVRTDAFGAGEDHASLVVAVPRADGGFSTYEIGFFAGKPGESAGAVRFLGGPRGAGDVGGAKIVTAPMPNGYSFEATVPWAAMPETARVRVGMRGVARYAKASAPGTIETIVATADGEGRDPATLPPLPTESEQAMMEQLLAPNGLARTRPAFDRVADVAGDATLERVAVFDHYVTLCGSKYLDGQRFYFKDLGGALLSLDLRSVTGRHKADLVIRKAIAGPGGSTRESVEVLSAAGTNGPAESVFEHEVAVTNGGRRVSDAIDVRDGAIELRVGDAQGWDASSYHEPTSSDVDAVLLPWGRVRSQTYKFDGTRFVKDKEVAQAGVAPPPGPSRPPPIRPPEPPTPPVRPSPADLSRQVFDLYKRDRGISAGAQPKLDVTVNVAGDARPERVVVIDRDIVVFGPGFKSGTSYAYVTMVPFADASSVLEASVRDLTGDGAADVMVRGIHRQSGDAPADEPVSQEMILVYALNADAIQRVFAAEVAREQAGKRVQGRFQIVPSGRGGFDIDLSPGTVSGWSQSTYPWRQEDPGGAIEPLLLPWGGVRHYRYSWNGSAFARVDQ